jgi:hypothetical protein
MKAIAVLVLAGAMSFSIGSAAKASAPRAQKQPTLGLAGPWKKYFGLGFGKVRPKTVYLGGDATNQVRKIHWTTWGKARAIGHGIALYANSGPVSNYPSAKATIVAYSLGTCGRNHQSAYKRIEWFFPSKGGQFNASVGTPTCAA